MNDFTQGKMWKNIMAMAVPMMVAQLINVLYSVVDRIYIGHLPVNATEALTGLGITFPILMLISAFSSLIGMGGAPLCSIARGEGNHAQGRKIMNLSFTLLLMTAVLLTVFFYVFKEPVLTLFGASAVTFQYADAYLSIYLLGTVFVMIGLGMNSFINSQGFGKTAMLSVGIGAVANLILDPIFIFGFGLGVRGAALATIISQGLSALWVLGFLVSKRAIYRLRLKEMGLDLPLTGRILALGLSPFTMQVTNSLVQVVCNITLGIYGGDIYIGVMTVFNSIREVLTLPVLGMTSGAQPVLSYNYGAGRPDRLRTGITFIAWTAFIYTFISWVILMVFPEFFISLFNHNEALISLAVPALKIYFFGLFMMALQFSGQIVFQALGKAKQAIFFSLFRKVIIVVPLTLLLPRVMDLGVNGVFLAEPISNFVGGSATFLTMMVTIWRKLEKEPPVPE